MKRRKQIKHKNLWLLITGSVVIFVILALIGAQIWKNLQAEEVYPLDGKLEYIGKRDRGCGWFCNDPNITYAYATDLTPPELAEYFRGAKPEDPSQIEEWGNMSSSFVIDFITDAGTKFYLYYDKDVQDQVQAFEYKNTSKRFIVDINDEYYQVAKESLKRPGIK